MRRPGNRRTVFFLIDWPIRVQVSELGTVAAKEVMPKLVMTSTDGETKTFDVDIGATVMEVGRDELMGIEGTCGGCLSCATCHVIVDPDWFKQSGEVSDDEDEMLDMAAERTPTSRLGCQIEMTDDLDGLTVIVPDEY